MKNVRIITQNINGGALEDKMGERERKREREGKEKMEREREVGLLL